MPSFTRLQKGVKQTQQWLQHERMASLCLLAIIIGCLAGCMGIALHLSIGFITSLWIGEHAWDLSLDKHIAWYLYLIAPTSAGLFVGYLVVKMLPNGELRGVAGVLSDLVERKGRVNRKQIITETVGTAISIGSGASLGREGPTVALGAVIGSEIGAYFRLSEQHIRTLLGCGVAAGIAASFNTPIAGVLFAVEIILADYALTTLSPIIISSVIATTITREVLGNFPAFNIPAYGLISPWELPYYGIVGIVCGLLAVGFIRSLTPTRQWLARLIPNRVFRPAVAGFCLGLLALITPEVFSIGYHTVENIMLEQYHSDIFGIAAPVILFLFVLLITKLAATILSICGGFPGGLLGPTLFIGAITGTLLGTLFQWHNADISVGAYALVACGAMAAACLQAPLTIVLMIFELTVDYHIMLPLMAACIIATLVKQHHVRETVFTESLVERGIDVDAGPTRAWMRSISVSRIPWKKLPSVYEKAPLIELKKTYIDTGKGCVQVIDEQGLMIGLVTFIDLQPWLLDETLDHLAVAGEVANRQVKVVSETDSLLDAIALFDKESFEQVPVVAKDQPRKVLGMLSRNGIFSTYHRLIVKHGEPDA